MNDGDDSKAYPQSQSRKRTFWDVLPALSAFLSSVVLGVVALFVNASYNERQSLRAQEAQNQQHLLNKAQTLVAFMPHLSSTPEMREVALFGISALGYPDLAIRLTQLRRKDEPESARNVADAIMREAPASVSASATPAETVTSSKPTSEIGWVYLGNYSAGTWSSQYLEFAKTASPDALIGQTFTVSGRTGALNVRVGMPTEQGEFLKVVKVLQPGQKVRILELHPWSSTGYMWARVAAA